MSNDRFQWVQAEQQKSEMYFFKKSFESVTGCCQTGVVILRVNPQNPSHIMAEHEKANGAAVYLSILVKFELGEE